MRGAGLPTEEDDHAVRLGRDEAEHEHVAHSAAVALQHRLSQGVVLVEDDLLVLGLYQVVNHVASARAGPRVAKPAPSGLAPGHISWVVEAAVPACVLRKLLLLSLDLVVPVVIILVPLLTLLPLVILSVSPE